MYTPIGISMQCFYASAKNGVRMWDLRLVIYSYACAYISLSFSPSLSLSLSVCNGTACVMALSSVNATREDLWYCSLWVYELYDVAFRTMASAKKKQDEKNLKILRELVSLPGNKECFDCHQRGPTYVNMTIGSFVCTSCSGML